jgi:hypothetical protein
VLKHGEGIICAGPLATTVEVPGSKARRFATAHRRPKDFGIGHGRQPTQLNASTLRRAIHPRFASPFFEEWMAQSTRGGNGPG